MTCSVELIKIFVRISKTKNMFESFFFQLLKCFLQLTWYYKYINNFYIHTSFKLKKNIQIWNFYTNYNFLKQKWLCDHM